MRLSGRQGRVVIGGAKYKLVATHMTAEGPVQRLAEGKHFDVSEIT